MIVCFFIWNYWNFGIKGKMSLMHWLNFLLTFTKNKDFDFLRFKLQKEWNSKLFLTCKTTDGIKLFWNEFYIAMMTKPLIELACHGGTLLHGNIFKGNSYYNCIIDKSFLFLNCQNKSLLYKLN